MKYLPTQLVKYIGDLYLSVSLSHTHIKMGDDSVYTSIEDESKMYTNHASARKSLANASESENKTYSNLETTEVKGGTRSTGLRTDNNTVVVVLLVLLVVAVGFEVFIYMKLESRDQELTKVSFIKTHACFINLISEKDQFTHESRYYPFSAEYMHFMCMFVFSIPCTPFNL